MIDVVRSCNVQRYETNVRYRIESLSATDCWRDYLTTNQHEFKLQRGAPRLATHHVSHTNSYIYFRLLGIAAFPTRDSWPYYVSLDSDAARSVPSYMVEPQPYTVPSFPRYEANAKTDSDSRSDVACVRLSRFKLVPKPSQFVAYRHTVWRYK